MISYYGYTLSPNQIETGEGFLICKNVPIARIGSQDYAGHELGLTGQDANQIYRAIRTPEEVFSEAAMASFEGKPVTNDHPPDLIGPDDVSMYEKGHAQNVRKGSGRWDGFLIADLHIHSRDLIEAIKAGKREISCGYECEYDDNGDGTLTQRNIRGNHIAVVDKGRAGKMAAILDSNYKNEAVKPPERMTGKMAKISALMKLFGLAVKDKSPDEIEKMAMDAAEAMAEDETKEPEKDPTPAKDEPYKEKMYEPIDDAALDGLLEKLMAKMAERKAAEEAAEKNPLDGMIEKLTGGEAEVQPGGGSEDAFGEEAHTVPAEEMDAGQCMDKQLAAAILKQMQPAVAGIKDSKQRNAVADALIKCVTAKDSASDIGKLLQISQNAAKTRAADSKPMDLDAIQAAYDQCNPHKTKKEV